MKRAVGKDRLGNRRTLRAGPPYLIITYTVKRTKRKPRKKLSEKVTNINCIIMIRDYTMSLCRVTCARPLPNQVKEYVFLWFNVIQKDYVDRV